MHSEGRERDKYDLQYYFVIDFSSPRQLHDPTTLLKKKNFAHHFVKERKIFFRHGSQFKELIDLKKNQSIRLKMQRCSRDLQITQILISYHILHICAIHFLQFYSQTHECSAKIFLIRVYSWIFNKLEYTAVGQSGASSILVQLFRLIIFTHALPIPFSPSHPHAHAHTERQLCHPLSRANNPFPLSL